MRVCTLLLCLAFFGLSLSAQIRSTQVYLFELEKEADTLYNFKNPRYLTAFNPNGYNNQPSFFSADKICLSVQTPADVQPELYLLDLKTEQKTQLTKTREGEYSPRLVPGYTYGTSLDDKFFSAVRQEYTQQDTVQRLWRFGYQPVSNGEVLLPYNNNVGYYNWINSSQLAVFLVGNPNKLALADTRTGQVQDIAQNTGRSFSVSNGNLIYVQKNDYSVYQIMVKNLYNQEQPAQVLINTMGQSEDFTILADGTILMALGSIIYKYKPRVDQDWVEIVNLRTYDIRNITRMAIGPNGKQLAIVAE